MVILRSLDDGRVLVDMIAGTEHPNPMSRGTMLRPLRPTFLRRLSVTKATRAI